MSSSPRGTGPTGAKAPRKQRPRRKPHNALRDRTAERSSQCCASDPFNLAPTHPPPSACELRLLLNGLAASRAASAVLAADADPAALWGGLGPRRRPDLCPCPAPGHGYHGSPLTATGPGETVARSDRRTRCSANPDFKVRCHGERRKRRNGFRDRRLND